jgi:hypothetical protein
MLGVYHNNTYKSLESGDFMTRADEIIERMKRNAPIRERVIQNIILTRGYREDSENLTNAAQMCCGPQRGSHYWSDENDKVLRQDRLFNRLMWLWQNNGPATEESFGNDCIKMANRTMTRDQYYTLSSYERFCQNPMYHNGSMTTVKYKKGIKVDSAAA